MIEAVVKDIQNCDNLHIVKFDFQGQTLSMMSLELDESVKIGTKVLLQTKSSHVALGKNISGELSYSNQLKSQILSIDTGKLLCSIKVRIAKDSVIESIITKNSLSRMNLKENDTVIAFIKASELSIAKVL
ncbi:MAG: TOBE domain-containing protein [Campylobacterota bacterium]